MFIFDSLFSVGIDFSTIFQILFRSRFVLVGENAKFPCRLSHFNSGNLPFLLTFLVFLEITQTFIEFEADLNLF